MSHKELPLGIWVFIPNLPPNTTEATLSKFFWKFGIAVTHNRITIKDRSELDPSPQSRQFALVSFQDEVFTELMAKAIGNEPFDGVQIKLRPNRSKTACKARRDTANAWPPVVEKRTNESA
jgi:RNA recognition motif-containing protein